MRQKLERDRIKTMGSSKSKSEMGQTGDRERRKDKRFGDRSEDFRM